LEKDRKLLRELNVLKGIAIIFVVLVHIGAPFQYASLEGFIQHFQSFMYLFMFASGFLLNYSGRSMSSFSEYCLLVEKKFKHLLIPYISVSIIILVTKAFAGLFFKLKHPISNNVWIDIFLNPMGGFASHLWFIYVLFIIFMIFPAIRLVKSYLLMSLIALAVFFLNIHSMGYMYSEIDFEKINKLAGLLFFIFLVFLGSLFFNQTRFFAIIGSFLPFHYAENLYFLFQGIGCIFTYYYLSVVIARRKNILTDTLDYIGNYSFSIYLLHTIFMGWVCNMLDQYLHQMQNIYFIVLLAVVGLSAPILSTKYIIVKNRFLSVLIFGTDTPSFRR
jgi:fucose 4-O-acetylase-like acetyltransferase